MLWGEFAPKFAELNDDVLFGQVWSREDKLSMRDRSIVTVVALMAQTVIELQPKSKRWLTLGRERPQAVKPAAFVPVGTYTSISVPLGI